MRKSIDELRKLNTKNLPRYHKSERRSFYGAGYTTRFRIFWSKMGEDTKLK